MEWWRQWRPTRRTDDLLLLPPKQTNKTYVRYFTIADGVKKKKKKKKVREKGGALSVSSIRKTA